MKVEFWIIQYLENGTSVIVDGYWSTRAQAERNLQEWMVDDPESVFDIASGDRYNP